MIKMLFKNARSLMFFSVFLKTCTALAGGLKCDSIFTSVKADLPFMRVRRRVREKRGVVGCRRRKVGSE